MNRFKNMTNQKEISEAIVVANSLLMAGSKMIEEVFHKNDWQYQSGNGSEIAIKLLVYRESVHIFTYRPMNIFSRAISYYDGKAIHFNIRKLPTLSHLNLVANLVHEWCHVAGFSHGNNFPSEHKNLFSVPYFLSSNINQGKWP